MTKHPFLFKKDTKGNIRVWSMETDKTAFRTISGLLDGQKVTSAWTLATPKNVGKSNSTSGEEQAETEVEALYVKQLAQGGYHLSMNDIDNKIHFEPMLAQKYDEKKIKFPVFCQPKLDGVRCILTKNGMFSREGKPIISAPHIFEDLKSFFDKFPNIVLDGELYNHSLKEDFNKIISLVKKTKPTEDDLIQSKKYIQYWIYDLYHYDNIDVLFDRRSRELHSYNEWPNSIVILETLEVKNQEDLDNIYANYLSKGFEGQMIRLNGPYENKRSKNLLKRKEFIDEEFKVLSISEGLGNWSGFAKSIECITKEGKIFSSGVKGNQDFCRELLTRPIKHVTVRYQNLTPDGIPRFPVAVAFWEQERNL